VNVICQTSTGPKLKAIMRYLDEKKVVMMFENLWALSFKTLKVHSSDRRTSEHRPARISDSGRTADSIFDFVPPPFLFTSPGFWV
jgi:hypothetical protein